jgi:hypothetical protein
MAFGQERPFRFFARFGKRRTISSEVMKRMTKVGVVFLFAVFAVSASYGEQARGVAGVDVIVKQNPGKRAVTDSSGNFAFDGLAPGAYTLTFRSRKAQNLKSTTTDKVVVASSYSIKIEGTKRSVNQGSLSSDKLLAGVDIPVQIGAGAKVRGQVAAGALKKMVWIPGEPGSHIPGHWAEAGSGEAARRHDTQTLSREDLMNALNRGNPNQADPAEPIGVQTSGR